MGSVPFILFFIVNGISSNIKWRMSAVWEKQKNQYTSRLHMREARSCGCQALQSLLGQTTRERQWARKGTPAKQLLWKQAVPWASCTLCPTILPPIHKEGVSSHTWCTDTHATRLWAQHSCHSWGHPQFRQHTWVELPLCKLAGLSSSQALSEVRYKGSWGTREEMASLLLELRNRCVHPGRGHAQIRVWADSHVLEKLCPKRCDGVRGCQAEQWSSFL